MYTPSHGWNSHSEYSQEYEVIGPGVAIPRESMRRGSFIEIPDFGAGNVEEQAFRDTAEVLDPDPA